MKGNKGYQGAKGYKGEKVNYIGSYIMNHYITTKLHNYKDYKYKQLIISLYMYILYKHFYREDVACMLHKATL